MRACVRPSVPEYDHSRVLLHCYVDCMYYRSTVHKRTAIYVETTVCYVTVALLRGLHVLRTVISVETTVCYVTELQYCTNSKLLDGILIEFAVNRLLDKCYCKIYRAMNCNTGA